MALGYDADKILIKTECVALSYNNNNIQSTLHSLHVIQLKKERKKTV